MHDSHTQQQSTDPDAWCRYCVQSAMRNVKEVFEKFDTVSYFCIQSALLYEP